MECNAAREILSAQLDQEADNEEASRANRHLGRCTGCSQWWTSVGNVTRTLRVRPAETIPDIATPALSRSGNARRWTYQSARISLALLAVIELVFAVTGVLAGRDAAPIHDSQHLGAFGAAFAVAVLFAAWRPGFARGLMPVAVTLGIAIPAFAVIDLINENLTTGGGIHHVVQMVGLALIWIVSGQPTTPALVHPVPKRPSTAQVDRVASAGPSR